MTAGVTRYAKSGDVHIAYRVEGNGPLDIVLVLPHAFSIDSRRATQPAFRAVIDELGQLGRVILFDKRGVGSSDRVAGAPTLEERMDDVRAVMDAVGSRAAALVGVADGAAMSLLFAATFPERTVGLALLRAKPRYVWAPDYPWAPTAEEYERQTMAMVERSTAATNGDFIDERAARYGISLELSEAERADRLREFRLAQSPGMFIALRRMNMEIDVRGVLNAINVPTLLIYRPSAPDAYETGDAHLMTYMAEQIPHAEIIEVPGAGEDGFLWYRALIEPLKDFLPRALAHREHRSSQPSRVLATVLFTDLVESTSRAVALGPQWQTILRQHNAVIRRRLREFSGSEIETAGDAFFASGFDGPARAIRCGCAIRDSVAELGLGIRVGVHTGECDIVDGKLSGLSVHIGARVAAQAQDGQVLVSGTVRDLVAGSGIEFEPLGMRELKGAGEWPLYAVTHA
jgi:pimeloyl-ACP methyl ester carboxylesterase/class 3 adenylate cyclase